MYLVQFVLQKLDVRDRHGQILKLYNWPNLTAVKFIIMCSFVSVRYVGCF